MTIRREPEKKLKTKDSEFRRVYMKKLVKELVVINGLTHPEAKMVASSLVAYFGNRIQHGKPLDLGFLKIIPRPSKPTVIKCNVGRKSVIHMGETVRWQVRITKSWQKQTKPFWSRY